MDEPNNPTPTGSQSGEKPEVTPASRTDRPADSPTDRGLDTNMTKQAGGNNVSGTPANGFDLNNPTIISLLYLASYFTGITGIIGIVLAHVWQSEAAEWERSHYTYLIRTFWLGLVGFVIGFLTLIVAVGFLILPAVGIWVVVRSVLSLVRAQKREAMPDPDTFLF